MIIQKNEPKLTKKFQKVSKQVVRVVRHTIFEPQNKDEIISAKKEIRIFVKKYLNVVNISEIAKSIAAAQGIEPMTDHGFLFYGLYSEKVPINLGEYLVDRDLAKGSHRFLHRKRTHIQLFANTAKEAINFIPIFCDMIERNDPYLHNLYEYYTKTYASPLASQEEKRAAEAHLSINYRQAFIAMRCLNWSTLLKGTRSIANILKGLYKLKGESDVNKAAIQQMRAFYNDNSERFNKLYELASTF